MLIPAVEDGLEALLRDSLPLPRDVGDISFETPSGTWAAQVNRITVNLFLYGVSRSPQPPRPAALRPGPDGHLERRPALPMVQLSYLVSAWAGSIRDEHQLLGDVLTRLIANQILPDTYVSPELTSGVQLSLATDDLNRPREVWSALGGTLKASFTLIATVASDAFDWEVAPRGVSTIEGLASPVPVRRERTRTATRSYSTPAPAGPVTRNVRQGRGIVRSAVTEGGGPAARTDGEATSENGT